MDIGVTNGAYWLSPGNAVFGYLSGMNYTNISISNNNASTYTHQGVHITYSLFARPWIEVSPYAFN